MAQDGLKGIHDLVAAKPVGAYQIYAVDGHAGGLGGVENSLSLSRMRPALRRR